MLELGTNGTHSMDKILFLSLLTEPPDSYRDNIDIEKQRDNAVGHAQYAAVVCMQDNYVHHISNTEKNHSDYSNATCFLLSNDVVFNKVKQISCSTRVWDAKLLTST